LDLLRPLDFFDEPLPELLRDFEPPPELPPRRCDFPPRERELDPPLPRDPPRFADRLEPPLFALDLRDPPDFRLDPELPPRDLAEREPPDLFELLDFFEALDFFEPLDLADELLREPLDLLLEERLERPLDLDEPPERLPPRCDCPPPLPPPELCPIRCAATAPSTPPTTAPIGPATLPITAPVAAPAAGFGTWKLSDEED
jgi:hypothetical protein